jgi:hypothetical protein
VLLQLCIVFLKSCNLSIQHLNFLLQLSVVLVEQAQLCLCQDHPRLGLVYKDAGLARAAPAALDAKRLEVLAGDAARVHASLHRPGKVKVVEAILIRRVGDHVT